MLAEAKRRGASSVSDGYRYGCPSCGESFDRAGMRTHMEWHRTPQALREAAMKQMVSCGVMREHQEMRLGNFPAYLPLVRAALDAGKSLLIQGPAGTGKTSLMAAILFEQLMAGRSCRFVLSGEIFREIRGCYEDKAEASERAVIGQFTEWDLLAIDDMGREGKPSAAVCSVLHEILSKRIGSGAMSAATTNLTLVEIGERYDGAIRSRLAGWVPIVMEGKDWRERL